MDKFFKLGLVGAVIGVMAAGHAATDTTTFQVKIVITESCDIEPIAAADVDFGSRVRSSTVPQATGTLYVNCSTGTPYAVGLNNGTNYDAPNTVRRMTDGTNFVPYGLYKSAGTSDPWTGASTVSGTGTGATQSMPVYGSLYPNASNVPAGTYADTVTATITY